MSVVRKTRRRFATGLQRRPRCFRLRRLPALARRPSRQRPRRRPSWLVPLAVLSIAAVTITAIGIVLSSRAGRSGSGAVGPAPGLTDADERAWEVANQDQIVALKSAAEALTIQGNLPEAHA